MIDTISALQDAGVEPDVRKIEGLDRRDERERIVAAARRDGRTTVGCIVLGRGSDQQAVVRGSRSRQVFRDSSVLRSAGRRGLML